MYSNKAIPPTMKPTKTAALVCPAAIETSAGPGQNPAKPQPAPNKTAPITKGRSTLLAVGKCNAPPKKVTSLFLANAKENIPTTLAPPMTKAKEGSQGPKRSKNPSTLLGSVMPERIKPTPNKRPTKNSLIRCCIKVAFTARGASRTPLKIQTP